MLSWKLSEEKRGLTERILRDNRSRRCTGLGWSHFVARDDTKLVLAAFNQFFDHHLGRFGCNGLFCDFRPTGRALQSTFENIARER